MVTIQADVVVVGGGTGAVAAAVQAARRGAATVLVSEGPWLGGMLTAAGVSAPDGHELRAWQTGLWGAFLGELARRQPGGVDHGWVSFFTYEPRVGAAIFRDWVTALPNLQWIQGERPRRVLRQGQRVLGVQCDRTTIHATITVDGTELGDLLALGDIPHRWGWDVPPLGQEPSAPGDLGNPQDPLGAIAARYPVQAPTWVVVLQDFGPDGAAPLIPPPADYDPALYTGAWDAHGPEAFLSYGQLPGGRFMINWPHRGNDYGVDLGRLIQGEGAWQAWAKAAIAHSQGFAHFIQTQIQPQGKRRYGLALDTFPVDPQGLGGGAFALQPYYRESRRLVGLATVTEADILPVLGGQRGALPRDGAGRSTAIALGNYPNDHHYPGFEYPLAPKALRWGGRWTGTPFTVPYGAIVPQEITGFLVCEKNISVSHMANGATRLQPMVLSLGQAAGMAAALCCQSGCDPQGLPIEVLQAALLEDPIAPVALVPCFDLVPEHPHWRDRQEQFLADPDTYPRDGYSGLSLDLVPPQSTAGVPQFTGNLGQTGDSYTLTTPTRPWALVTLCPQIHHTLQTLTPGQPLQVWGHPNPAGGWLRVVRVQGSADPKAS